MWKRFKWCVLGGLGYAIGRHLFYLIKDFLETL